MSFSYDPTKLDEPINQMRFKLGLTTPNTPVGLEDEEIQFCLDQNDGNVAQACLDCLDSLITSASMLVDRTTGQVSEALSQLLDNLLRRRDDLISSLANVPILLHVTGVDSCEYEDGQLDETVYHDDIQMENIKPNSQNTSSFVSSS
tara:strand:+ start:33513 stop:33953 length:441 start_codon:yes stop_codon:yes gene_type:complete